MADTEAKSKSGRTPEQQAARDARKAAKKAAAEAAAAPATESHEDAAEDRTSRKRAAEDDADLLEIDLGANAPMSKAEARAARKRAKRGEEPLPPKQTVVGDNDKDVKDGEADGPPKRAPKAEKPEKPKPQNSVWIGNLSFRTTPESLQAWLEKGIVESGGEPGSVTRVNLPKKVGRGTFSENKGFAYCDFKTEDLMLLAVGLSEKNLDGRRLLIKRGDDHQAKPDARTPKPNPSGPGTHVLQKQKHAESSTLFIGNLPFDVTEEELRNLVETNAAEFAGAAADDESDSDNSSDEDSDEEDEDEDKEEKEEGAEDGDAAPGPSARAGLKANLIKTRVAQFEDTGRCKGFAFWDFKTPEDARRALLNRKNHFLRNGIRLNLQYASTEATNRAGGRRRDGGEGMRGGRGGGRGGRGGGRGGRPERPQRYFDGNAGGDGDEGGSYEDARPSRAWGPGAAAPTDFKSEAAAQARIAAQMVSGGGGWDAQGGGEEQSGGRKGRVDMRGKKWESTGRPRPGAALAMAQREKVGIVESAGSKIVFD